MSSSNKPNYARIGAFIVTTALLAVAVLAYLGGIGKSRNEFLCETYFSDPVSGLDVGSAVNFRGVRIGSVKRISFVGVEYIDADEADVNTIWVQLALDVRQMNLSQDEPPEMLDRLLAKGLHATVSSSGVTGLSHIEVNFPRSKIADKKISWRPRSPCIPPAPSILQSASDSAQQILDQINRMDLLHMWTNAVECAASANALLGSSAALVGSQQGVVAEILANLRETSANLRDFSQQIRDNPGALLRSNYADPLPETR